MTDYDPWANPSPSNVPPSPGLSWPENPIACGRCGAADLGPDDALHFRWECVAQDAWIEAAINDRKARPDRYRQAKRDISARGRTLKNWMEP